jgi:phenylacetate-coenzyme A ligase PaaK-like adenylate-forming protein
VKGGRYLFKLTDILDAEAFSFNRIEKSELYLKAFSDLTKYHYEKCFQYKRLLDVLGVAPDRFNSLVDIPFLPVRLFKEYELLSIDRSQVVKTMTSSGTTGQSVSKIFLDKDTSANQTKVLTKLVSSFIGKKRLPMLVIDSRAVIKDRNLFSARGAGILGFSMFGYDVAYALDDQMQLDVSLVQAFLEKHKDEQILLFGFTFMIWEHFYSALKSIGIRLELDNGIMIHGGGWKKLIDQAVDNNAFKKSIFDVSGIARIHNYYGMVEQTGSIFMECEAGHLHASIFSDILIRDHRDFSSLPAGQEGLVQLLSLLPLSYPGHSILSEDVGEILGEDNCICERKGKYFKIHGRIKNAEARGCSDTYATAA